MELPTLRNVLCSWVFARHSPRGSGHIGRTLDITSDCICAMSDGRVDLEHLNQPNVPPH